jgi:DNA-binding response OmpR family regulator
MERILLIGGSEYLEISAAPILSRAGYTVILESSEDRSLKRVYSYWPHLILLDGQTNPLSSLEVCSQIHRIGHIPLIVIVNNPENAPRYLYFGADACLSPADSELLLLTQIRSLFRRYKITNNSLPAGVQLDPESWQISFNGSPIQFTPTEYLFLAYLIKRRGNVVPYQDLLINVWGSREISQGSIKFYLSSLRKKLSGQAHLTNLVNCRGVGLRLDYNDKLDQEQLKAN